MQRVNFHTVAIGFPLIFTYVYCGGIEGVPSECTMGSGIANRLKKLTSGASVGKAQRITQHTK